MWEAIRPFKAKKRNMGKQISEEEWVGHFKKQLGEEKQGVIQHIVEETAQNRQEETISTEPNEELERINNKGRNRVDLEKD